MTKKKINNEEKEILVFNEIKYFESDQSVENDSNENSEFDSDSEQIEGEMSNSDYSWDHFSKVEGAGEKGTVIWETTQNKNRLSVFLEEPFQSKNEIEKKFDIFFNVINNEKIIKFKNQYIGIFLSYICRDDFRIHFMEQDIEFRNIIRLKLQEFSVHRKLLNKIQLVKDLYFDEI